MRHHPEHGHGPSEPDYEFRHHLYSVLVLLGCRKDIAALLKKSQDGWIASEDVEEVKRYAAGLIDQTKDKLANINKMTIQT